LRRRLLGEQTEPYAVGLVRVPGTCGAAAEEQAVAAAVEQVAAAVEPCEEEAAFQAAGLPMRWAVEPVAEETVAAARQNRRQEPFVQK